MHIYLVFNFFQRTDPYSIFRRDYNPMSREKNEIILWCTKILQTFTKYEQIKVFPFLSFHHCEKLQKNNSFCLL
jgi:hypothetical protein